MTTLQNLRLNPAKAGTYLLDRKAEARALAQTGLENVPGFTVSVKQGIYIINGLACIGSLCALAYVLASSSP